LPCDRILEERSLLNGEATATLHANFPATPATAGLARALVRSVLDGVPGVDHDVVWAAELLTSELVTNAIVHSGTHVHVGVALGDERMMIAVADGSDEPSPTQHDVVDDDESGRGMLLVASIADDFGWWIRRDGAAGKTIWVVLSLTGRATGD
jgi:anti-sigma regulatory factor (Ser/Thr protein kinase)